MGSTGVWRQREDVFRRDAVQYRRGRYARAGPGVQVGVGILTVLVSDRCWRWCRRRPVGIRYIQGKPRNNLNRTDIQGLSKIS